MAEKYQVALLIESSRAYGRDLCRGIARYALERGTLTLFTQEQDIPRSIPEWLKSWRGDGILARIHNRTIAEQLLELKIPVVDLLCREPYDGIPMLVPDADGIAALAIDFFANAGFENFAFCGYPGISFSEFRSAAFVRAVEERGLSCDCYRPPANFRPDILNPEPTQERQIRHLVSWLRNLPKPVALLACNDVRGQRLLSLCAEHGIHVPEEISVMGVDDDDVLCNLTNPPLSSIDPGAQEIGHRAAALLEAMMAGGKPATLVTSVMPKDLVERGSTDTVAVSEPAVVKALRYIRQHAPSGGVNVDSVLKEAGLSRTSLDVKFRRHLGRSVSDEIMRIRLQRIRTLLRQTDMPLAEIAKRSGFLNPSHMCAVFRRTFGNTPGDYRKG